ncbi:AraC family transcriptional regulator [Vibrio sp. D404a]|uniref:helix-turn-helix domain-containing protein n=1 Tax=unclassified Vibrio TaxID=2614977 RepID=UPI002555C1D6|nr:MULTISPECIES: helix-turn-helix domain-containing protein [unclassified Vibrio]MDK9737045.1 AraC family transcriptional regulator [Vibrio sp. D404a]MDK9797187.1 AraC family transcriptional regulator [Vibrio sp. D449a]
MKQSIKSVKLILGEPCKAIDSPIEQSEPYIEPHRHEYWEVIWCLNDQGTQQIDFVEYQNKVGRLFTVAPGQVHCSDEQSSAVRLLVFAHGFVETNKRSTQLVDTVFATRNARPPYIDCDPEADEYLLPVFKMIQEECAREDCDWPLVESLINCFLRYMMRFASNISLKGEERDPRVGKVIELIELHYRNEKNSQFYADALALTTKRINEIVKGQLGKTVTQLIHDRVILEANRDLAFSDKTIKTLAYELGFADQAYFSRFYRKHMKESPAQFRVRCLDSATL